MRTAAKPFAALTAGDLMSCDVVLIPQEMGMREAALLLLQARVSGAPVVDAGGRCVGILSATDFVHLARQTETGADTAPERPVTCGYQEKRPSPNGTDLVVCKLPPGTCALQRPEQEPGGGERTRCREPHCVPTDWQVVNVTRLPTDPVQRYMTTDLATAEPETRIGDLARRMIDAHIHRLIVADEELRPVGIVSSTDILAAVAYAECFALTQG
jgi:CBS domain-containing protein